MFRYLLLAILIPFVSVSQTNLKVSYRPVITINLDTVEGPSNFKKTFKNSIEKSELLSFNLLINCKDDSSVFQQVDLTDASISNLDLTVIKVILDTDGKYYSSKGKLVHDYYILEKNLKVEIENQINWRLINEKKSIGNYECLKAVGEVQYGKHKGETIEAWYSISIPLPYGPKMFHGLPGLILEVKEKNNILYAEKIEFVDKDIRIKTPSKDKIISEKQADSILVIMNKKAENYFKN
jgi:GLPGLI family protein